MTVPELHERWERRRPPAGPRRARAQRVGRRPHPRLGPHALPRHPRACPTGIDPARPVAVDLRLRPALGRRREPAAAPRRRATSSTSSTAACRCGSARAGRSSSPDGLSAVLLAIPFGLAIGLAVGTLGGGGSVLAVPVLVYVLDQTVPEATTARWWSSRAGALAGAASATRAPGASAGATPARSPPPRCPGIALGTLAGEAVSGRCPARRLRARHARRRARDLAQGRRPRARARRRWERRRTPARRCGSRATALAGAAVGFVTGFFGVGGGFLIVPTLAVALAFTMRTAVGTSLAIITATSLLGLAAHLAAGRALDVRRHRRDGARLRGRRARRRRAGRRASRSARSAAGSPLLVVAVAAGLLVSAVA